MKLINNVKFIMLAFIFGLITMYFLQSKILYQGMTIKDWADTATFRQTMINKLSNEKGACYNDPSSTECNFIWNSPEALNQRTCEDPITKSADIVWHYKNCNQKVNIEIDEKTQNTTPQANMKHYQGMNCQPVNNDGSLHCTNYDYYQNSDPNPTAGVLPADMRMNSDMFDFHSQ